MPSLNSLYPVQECGYASKNQKPHMLLQKCIPGLSQEGREVGAMMLITYNMTEEIDSQALRCAMLLFLWNNSDDLNIS